MIGGIKVAVEGGTRNWAKKTALEKLFRHNGDRYPALPGKSLSLTLIRPWRIGMFAYPGGP